MNNIRKKNFPLAYPTDVMDIISNMSMTKLKGITIMGSMALRSQQYAGDYDLTEIVDGKYKSNDVAIDTYVRNFQSIIKHFLQREDCFIGDIKSGEVPEWQVIPNKQQDYSYTHSLKILDSLLSGKIITKEEYDETKQLLKRKPTKEAFILMKKSIKFHIVRWTPKEILGGAKRLPDGRNYWLKDAFESPSLTKLDIVALVQNNRFTDFSCIYIFKNNGNVLNNPEKDITGIEEDIYYYKSQGNWFKVAKRMFSMAKYNKDYKKTEKLNEILNSDLGRLYSIISDANTILYLLENESELPIEKIRYEIDQFRYRLSNIYTINSYIKKEDGILHRILSMKSLPNTVEGRKKLKSQMEMLVDYFQALLDSKSKEALSEIGLL